MEGIPETYKLINPAELDSLSDAALEAYAKEVLIFLKLTKMMIQKH